MSREHMEILSMGSGMQSTALCLMSCENAMKYPDIPHPEVPIYDAVIFCDLGFEPHWVMKQTLFAKEACDKAGIFFKILKAPLYEDFMRNYGERRTISIPWWTLTEDGHKAKMPRFCTIDYKIETISKYVRWELLGYKKGKQLKDKDKKAHFMHMGFSYEERKRCKENPNPMFTNKYPLVAMKWERANSYAYILETWGLDTKASACTFCPFHQNYFYQHMKENESEQYRQLLQMDNLLASKRPHPDMRSDLFISRSRKRLADLTPEDCDDAQCFEYCGKQIWNGF